MKARDFTDFAAAFVGSSREEADVLRDPRIKRQRLELLRHWSEHPWNFLAGEDLFERDIVVSVDNKDLGLVQGKGRGKQLIWTKDEKDAVHPLKPFPRDKPHIKRWIYDLHDASIYPEDHPLADPQTMKRILQDKVRQMYISTSLLLESAWECAFRDGRRHLLSKSTEEEATEMLQDKIAFPWTLLPPWVQAALPIKTTPQNKMRFIRRKSYVLAVNQMVAERAGRGGSASRIIIDEGPLQHGFGEIISASLSMAGQIVGVGTAYNGNPGARVYSTLVHEGLD